MAMATGAAAQKRVVIVSGAPLWAGATHPEWSSVYLPDPRTGGLTPYLLHAKGSILETQQQRHKYSCWAVGGQLLADGSLFLCTAVDPLFMLLPLLEKHAGSAFRSAEDIVDSSAADMAPFGHPVDGSDGARNACGVGTEEEAYGAGSGSPGWLVLQSALEHVGACVCDVRQVDEQTYFRLNHDRAMAWLRVKASRVAQALAACGGGAIASAPLPARLAYAAGMLSEYLNPSWAARLLQQLLAPAAAVGPPAAQAAVWGTYEPQMPPADICAAKMLKDPREVAKRKAAESRAEGRVAAMAKQAEGTRKISTFFCKK